jgi:hypothetical protein
MGPIVTMIKLRRMKLSGHVTCKVETRSVYEFLVRKPEGKRTLGRTKMDLKETE